MRGFAIALLLLLAGVARSSSAPTADQRYDAWHAAHAIDVRAYRQFLFEQGVGDVVPMPALLRSARMWRECGSSEFALPPRALWPQIVPTLRLVARLRSEGWIAPAMARSGYRASALNTCAGGSSRSRHLQNNALDFDLPPGGDVAGLCGYWRTHGKSLAMGLGFYTDDRIHVDTAGFRTWGADHTWRTSLCTADASP